MKDTRWFENLVAQSWSHAVMEASHCFNEARPYLVEALRSDNPEVRCAAVAAFNEANAADAHDLVFALSQDPDSHVRDEVLEFIEQFPLESDAAYLLSKIERHERLFLASSALLRLFGNIGPLLSEDDAPSELIAGINEWRNQLQIRGHAPQHIFVDSQQ